LIGALSIETAAHYLNARPIDGIIIGDGFSARLIEGFLAALKDDPRFRDMPIAALDMKLPIEPFHNALPNFERIPGGPPEVLDWVLPLARMRAFEARLKRMLKTIDANGMLDPDTGVLTDDSFAHEFARAVDDATRQGHGLCIARFAFDVGLDPRISLDAARLIAAAIRTVDFACRENDGAVLMVFTETELQEAHLVARRIATMLKKTMLVGDRRASHPPTGITLATLKADDTPETLLRRIGSRAVAAALVPA
jgi:GGDEF domain-containing protein